MTLDYEEASVDYDNKCILTFLSWGEPLFIKLQNATFDYYEAMDLETDDGANELGINLPGDIWQHCYPIRMIFARSEKYPFYYCFSRVRVGGGTRHIMGGDE